MATLAGLLLAATGLGCSRAHEPEPAARSALLVTLDTTRWDSVSFNGLPVVATPALDALARGRMLLAFESLR